MADKVVDQGLCNTIIKLLNMAVASSAMPAERENSITLLHKKVALLPPNTSFDDVLAGQQRMCSQTASQQYQELSKLRTQVANFIFVKDELRSVKAALRTAEVRNRQLEREIAQLLKSSVRATTTAQCKPTAANKPESSPPPSQQDTGKIGWSIDEHLFLLRQMTVDYTRPDAGNYHIPLYANVAYNDITESLVRRFGKERTPAAVRNQVNCIRHRRVSIAGECVAALRRMGAKI